MIKTTRAVRKKFEIYGDFVSAEPYGSGHINDTLRVIINQGGTEVHYIFQRINEKVFQNPPALMDNITRVTEHIFSKIETEGDKEVTRHTLYVINARDGKSYVQDEEGKYWRAYIFIEKAQTYDIVESPEQAYEAARAFGLFQKDLADLPGERLHETIPDFHNTPQRFANLEKAIATDTAGRAKDAQAEIDFILNRKADASILTDLLAAGKLSERITHNDTKLNNVMIDDESGKGVCVIDLDTVMPGLVHYDFGDMVRTSTSPAAEDEKDLSKVTMQFHMFESILRGYLSTAGDFLTPLEREHLPFAGKLITMEIGIRFLTDYLEGDIYFKTHREGHNLDRCRTQFKLVESIEEQMDDMIKLLNSI
jgi:Phosphotransferase enzyme family